MKKLISFLTCIILAMLVMTVSSCRRHDKTAIFDEDSLSFAESYNNLVNPTFTDADDMTAYQEVYAQQFKEDSVFRSLPSKMLHEIATVCIYKSGVATKKSIVTEYQHSKDIYDAMYRAHKAITEAPPDSLEEYVKFKMTGGQTND